MGRRHIQSKDKMEQLTFMLFLTIVTVLFILLLKPFFAPIFWACALALLFYPVQFRLAERWGNHPNLIALTTLGLCIVVLIIPVLFILSSFISEGTELYARIQRGEFDPDSYLDRMRDAVPLLERMLEWLDIDSMASIEEEATAGAIAASGFAARNAFTLGQTTFNFVLSLALMLYMTFFLLRDGSMLIDLITHALPLGDERERLLFAKFAEVTRATIKGNLIVSMVQGALGGLIFLILDMPTPVLWGVAMAIVSLIPAIGAGLIWLPFAIYLIVTGDVTSGVILIVYGVAVIGLADNVLRPILVGRDTRLPDWLVLISTLGGLVMFGIHGFVMGPLVAAVFIVFWQIFCKDYADEDLELVKEETPTGPHIPALFEEAAEAEANASKDGNGKSGGNGKSNGNGNGKANGNGNGKDNGK
ncbi:MAG TPA: AI-2E family transporter [Pseudomonadales bacterium]